MWALVEDNTITKIINNPKAMVIGEVRHSKNIFSFRWTNEEREAIGLYEVVFDNSNRRDESYYINTNQSFDFALTSVLKVDTALGTEYSATSVAFNKYQSVGVNKPLA